MNERFEKMKSELVPSEQVIENTLLAAGNEKVKGKGYKKYIALAACVAVIGTAAAAVLINTDRPEKSGTADGKYAETVPATEIAMECMAEKWENLEIYGQYPMFEYNGLEYDCNPGGVTVPADEVGEKIQDIIMSGFKWETGETFTKNAGLFEIKGVSRDAYIAVKYSGTEDYYAFRSCYYSPGTLGQLMEDTGIRDRIVFDEISVHRVENGMANIDKVYYPDGLEAVIDMLFSSPGAKAESRDEFIVSEADLYFSLKGMDCGEVIQICDNGYILISLTGLSGCSYYIGEETCREIVSFIRENGKVKNDYAYEPAQLSQEALTSAGYDPGVVVTAPAYDPNEPVTGQTVTTAPAYNPNDAVTAQAGTTMPPVTDTDGTAYGVTVAVTVPETYGYAVP